MCWFLDRPWSWQLHRWLDAVPLTLSLLIAAPLFWWAANRLDRR